MNAVQTLAEAVKLSAITHLKYNEQDEVLNNESLQSGQNQSYRLKPESYIWD